MDFVQKDLFIDDDSEILKYRRRNDEEKRSVGFGQRKLLLILTQFLTYYLKTENPVVVYAGAAPGTNIKIVAGLFPEVEWHLYDPAKFAIKSEPKIHIYRKCFTNKIAEQWKGKNVYFISDIRTADYTKTSNLDEYESQVLADMKMQRKWTEIIQPIRAHLKFRLPYAGGNRPKFVRYLDGIVLRQPWAPQTSTETRLIPVMENGKFLYKSWNCEQYESQLFYHNVTVRETYKYKNPFTGGTEGVDEPELMSDWDSRCEVQIWMDYLQFRNAPVTQENVIALSRLATSKLIEKKKYKDTLEYLRKHPQAIKKRNLKS